MSIEGLAPYSPTTIYGQLTSPFTPKTITINSHTPYDKVDEEQENSSEVFSRGYFEGKPQARSVYGKVSTQSAYENDLAKLSEDLAYTAFITVDILYTLIFPTISGIEKDP